MYQNKIQAAVFAGIKSTQAAVFAVSRCLDCSVKIPQGHLGSLNQLPQYIWPCETTEEVLFGLGDCGIG